MVSKKVLFAYILDLESEIRAVESRVEDLEKLMAPKPKKKAKANNSDTPKRGRGRPRKNS